MSKAPAAVVETIAIAAPRDAVYDLLSDVARMGEWSPEATGAHRAARQPAAGDTFVGANRRGPVRWWTGCTVRRAEPGTVFEFDVDFGPVPVSRWTYELADDGSGGTLLTETWVDRRSRGATGWPVRILGQLVIPGDRSAHNRSTMRATLERLKQTAEGR